MIHKEANCTEKADYQTISVSAKLATATSPTVKDSVVGLIINGEYTAY
jgi:hypothetical protein